MNKRTMLYLSVVSILFSLMYTLFEYYGGVRYLTLRMNSNPQSYVSKYSSVDRFDETRVVAVLDCTYCTVYVFPNLLPTLLSLLDQTVRIDEIAICESRDGTPRFPDIAMTYITKDALTSTITRERDANTIILFLDPCVIYGKDFVETILTECAMSDTKDQAQPSKVDTRIIKSKYCTCIRPNDVIHSHSEDGRISFPQNARYVPYTENYKY
jgi:hypothetical protein